MTGERRLDRGKGKSGKVATEEGGGVGNRMWALRARVARTAGCGAGHCDVVAQAGHPFGQSARTGDKAPPRLCQRGLPSWARRCHAAMFLASARAALIGNLLLLSHVSTVH
eukprot:contig_22891_g5653